MLSKCAFEEVIIVKSKYNLKYFNPIINMVVAWNFITYECNKSDNYLYKYIKCADYIYNNQFPLLLSLILSDVGFN